MKGRNLCTGVFVRVRVGIRAVVHHHELTYNTSSSWWITADDSRGTMGDFVSSLTPSMPDSDILIFHRASSRKMPSVSADYRFIAAAGPTGVDDYLHGWICFPA